MIKELQRNAAFRDPTMAAAHLVGAQAAAMQDAAKNEGGAAMAFMGMNMAGQAGGVSAQSLFQMGQQAAAPAAPEAPKADDGKCWYCPNCGTANKGKFCMECGTKKPAGLPQYRCDKCGWEPEDPSRPPKFCPECGDPFGEDDIVG